METPYIINIIVADNLSNGVHLCYSSLYPVTAKFNREEHTYFMNISSLGASGIGISLSDTSSMNAIDTSILKKSLDTTEQTGAMITKMMEQSVNPNLGANIDVRI
jgi:hypothetical protein